MQDQWNRTESVELATYAKAVRRRWWLVPLCMVLCGGLAILYAALIPRTVTASATVNVSVISSDTFGAQRSAAGLIDPVTEEQIARSSSVLEGAAAQLGGGTTVRDVRRAMTAEMMPEATVMRFTFAAGTTGTAAKGADALASSYLQARTTAATQRVERIRTRLQQTRDELRAELVDLNRVTATAPANSRLASEAAAQRDIINAQLDSLLSELNRLSAIDVSGGSLIASAENSPLSFKPRTRVLGGIGVALGLVLGLVAAVVAGTFTRRVDDSAAVIRAGGGPVLGRLRAGDGAVPGDEETRDEMSGVRERLLAALPSAPSVTIVDLTGDQQPTDVSANLMLSFVDVGQPVRLVLPTWSSEAVHQLADALGATLSWNRVEDDSHAVLELRRRLPVPVGTSSAGSPSDVDDSSSDLAPGHARDELSASVTLVALPPNARRSLLLSWARRSDGAVLVVARRQTPSERITSTAEDMEAVGAPVLGSVVVAAGRHLHSEQASTGRRR